MFRVYITAARFAGLVFPRWVALKTISWTDEKGVSRKWDVATRTTKQSPDTADAVVIVPILKSSSSKTLETVLVRQYRPPVGRSTLEFPAGLIDTGETAAAAALRELEEETGYVGKIDEVAKESPLLCMSPGLSDESVHIIVVDVDLDDEKNQNPKQKLDDGEAIQLKRLPLLEGMKDMMDSSCGMPITCLYSFFLGVELGLKHANFGRD